MTWVRRTRTRSTLVTAVLATTATLFTGCASPLHSHRSRPAAPPPPTITSTEQAGPTLPHVSPTPRQIRRTGPDLTVPTAVDVLRGEGADDFAVQRVEQALRSAGASELHVSAPEAIASTDADLSTREKAHPTDVRAPGLKKATPAGGRSPLTIVIGRTDSEPVAGLLKRSNAFGQGTLPAEGYQITTGSLRGRAGVLLAGKDTDGVYYAAQTFAQLIRRSSIAGASVVDYPSMPQRGVVEGFYGRPWTHQTRLDQLAFYGQMKLNTYLYAPKDDPYERDRWRDRYPAGQASRLTDLTKAARAHHVRFTYVLSPGKSICYNSPDDRQALTDKLDSLHDLGILDFAIAFDDIHPLPVWNCAADLSRWGTVTEQSLAAAQAELLNRVQREFIDHHHGMRPLRMVPTQYSDLSDTLYKRTLRHQLDERIGTMWTGTDVLPTSITADQARDAAAVWGRDVLLWDNYPVNDSDQTTGRLLLAPYAKRARRLDEHLSGVVLNPMNQAAASKVAELTGADYAWNTRAYDPTASARAAADHLAGGDAATAQALELFFDTQHLAPSWKGAPWQPQAPALAARLERFDTQWARGQKRQAVDQLRAYARLMAAAPGRIRTHAEDRDLATEAKPWLDALTLWSQALIATCDALQARLDGNAEQAGELLTRSRTKADQASELRTIAGATRPQGTVKVADGVLDTFLKRAPALR
ncbi:beta-N-acetylglucosaminidase domain-containing protein [Streptomyces sp. 769]|uniref:beta-N-acetylhexosaminidase family protein n=1 Tax=Streptomyces sp. 769 TaxID=1262452 RepID=UPI000582115E|nr:beta-N-acetylglucosaminidase domain-containing protein [Streptomyces sp. 769]AJC53626.1 putative O-GlcNAcase NagJ [Streptomyces sp. 769]